MPLEFFHGLEGSRSPEEFIRGKLLGWIRAGFLPSRDNRPLGQGHLGSKRISALVFTDGKRELPVEISVTRRSKKRVESGAVGFSHPALNVGRFSSVLVPEREFHAVERLFGERERGHGIDRSSTQALFFPESLVRHWSTKLVEKHGASGRVLSVPVNTQAFNDLAREVEVDVFCNRMANVLRYLQGRRTARNVTERQELKEEAMAHLYLGNGESKQSDPVAAFLEAHKKDRKVIIELLNDRKESKISAVLQNRFRNTPKLDFYINLLKSILTDKHMQDAVSHLHITAIHSSN